MSDCSVMPAAMDTMVWRSDRWGRTSRSTTDTYCGLTAMKITSALVTTCGGGQCGGSGDIEQWASADERWWQAVGVGRRAGRRLGLLQPHLDVGVCRVGAEAAEHLLALLHRVGGEHVLRLADALGHKAAGQGLGHLAGADEPDALAVHSAAALRGLCEIQGGQRSAAFDDS